MKSLNSQEIKAAKERQFEAAKRYAKLISKPRIEWDEEDIQFHMNYQAYMAWITNGKGLA